MKRKTIVWLIIFLFFLIILVGVASFLYLEIKQPISLPSAAYLEIKLRGLVTDRAPVDLFSQMIMNIQPVSLHDLWVNLRKAKNDDRIRCVLFRMGPLICDWGKVDEIRELVKEFQSSGKKVYFYLDELPEADREYYLATSGDYIILHPLGWLGVNGVGGYIPFLKNTLDKLGVQVEVEHVEEYKTAYHTFTEKGFTPAHKEMMVSLTQDIFKEYISKAASSRHLSEATYLARLDQGFFQGEKAKEAGLVDKVLFPDELEDLLKEYGRELKKVTLETYARVAEKTTGPYRGKRVAIVYAQGAIIAGESVSSFMGGETVGRWLRQVREDNRVKAVILRVDSPGGSAVGSDYIWREVILTRKQKPVVVSMSDVAGSGGYWISMGASKIVAHPQTLTGSIGVLAAKFDLSNLYKNIGITAERLVTSEHADIYSTFRPLSSEEKARLKEEIRWTYDQFLLRAAEGRGQPKEVIDQLGRGRVWTGNQAKQAGLIDELGGLTRALEIAKQLAGIPQDEQVKLDVWPKKVSLISLILGRRGEASSFSARLAVSNYQEILKRLEGENVLAIMPFWQNLR